MRRVRTPALLVMLLLLVGSAPLGAQVVRGKVMDDRNGEVLGATEVVLVDAVGRSVARARTDARGEFSLSVPGEGSYRVRATRLGYRDFSTEVGQVGGHVSLTLQIRLPTGTVAIDPLVVTARQARFREAATEVRGVEGFAARRRSARGVFLAREQIERHGPVRMTDVVRILPGVLPAPSASPSGGGDVVMRGSTCLPSVWIDGALVRPGSYRHPAEWGGRTARVSTQALWMSLDELVSPGEVEALEVYRGAGEVPPAFAGSTPSCGALVVWRRQAPDPRGPAPAPGAGGGDPAMLLPVWSRS